MYSLGHDVRYAIRALKQSPGFTVMAVLSLGLGIGANTSLFTVVNAVLLRPPAGVRAPERLVAVGSRHADAPRTFGNVSYADYADTRDQTAQVFDGLACTSFAPTDTRLGDKPTRLGGETVSANYFQVLGAPFVLGRPFEAREDRAGAPLTAVISHHLWHSAFGGSKSVLGRTIVLNTKPHEIIGVAGPGFHGLQPLAIDVWVPVAAEQNPRLEERGVSYLHVFGRLKDGVRPEQARVQVAAIGERLASEHPKFWTDVTGKRRMFATKPALDAALPHAPIVLFFSVLMTVVGLVLLIACANIANLLLARAESRRKEIAIRLSLGAGRGRVLQQLLTENVILSLAGAALALLLATWTKDLLMGFKPPADVPLALDLVIDARVLLFTLGIALLTSVLFGLAPALAVTRDAGPTLKDAGRAFTAGGGRFGLRNVLIAGQAAVSMLLLAGAGLFVRSLLNANSIDPGFNTANTMVIEANMGLRGYTPEQARLAHQRLIDALEAVPGVRSVDMTRFVPLSMNDAASVLEIEGRPKDPNRPLISSMGWVGPHFFETLDIRVVAGRAITDRDTAAAPGVVVVNEAFAKRFWPGENSIGKRISLSSDPNVPKWLEVVGIAKTGKYVTLGEEPTPFLYVPYDQDIQTAMNLVIRMEGSPRALLPTVRKTLHAADPDLPLDGLMTMEESLGAVLLPARLAGSVLGAFGALALLLAAVGLYGVMSYLVAQRTREIGVRMALGARPGDVVGMVLRRGMTVALAGMLAGITAAIAVTRFAATFLYGISPTDPPTFLGVFLLLGSVALFACWIPARRAARVAPMTALRYE